MKNTETILLPDAQEFTKDAIEIETIDTQNQKKMTESERSPDKEDFSGILGGGSNMYVQTLKSAEGSVNFLETAVRFLQRIVLRSEVQF